MSDTQGWKPKHMATGEKRPAPSAPSAARSASTDAKATESTENQVGRNAALMSFLVIVSRITGFFRTWGQSFALGAGMVASCYSVANNLPNQLYEIVVGGMLVTAFLPVYMSVKQREGEKGASRYTSNLVSIVTLLMGAVAVLGFIFAAQLVWTQSFSATSDFDADFATYLFRFFVVEVVLYSLSSIFSGVLNAERDYFWSSASSIFNNFVITASFLLYAALVNVNPTLATLILAIGNPAGVAVQVLVQMPSLRKHGIRLTWHIDWHDPAGHTLHWHSLAGGHDHVVCHHVGAAEHVAFRLGFRRIRHLLRTPVVYAALRYSRRAHHHGHVHRALRPLCAQ